MESLDRKQQHLGQKIFVVDSLDSLLSLILMFEFK